MKKSSGILVDARGLGLAHAARGIGRVIMELLDAFNRLGVAVDVAGPPVVRRHVGPTMRWVPKPARHWNWILSPGRLEADRVLRMAPTLPGPLDARSVACLYDLMPLKASLKHYPLRTRLRHPLAWPAMRRTYDLFSRVERIWTISRQTAVDAEAMLGVPREKLVPIPLAAPSWARPASTLEAEAVRARHALPPRFVLWVLSGLNDNKNVDGMLRAAATVPELPLVVAGSFVQSNAKPFVKHARAAGASYRLLGRVSDDDLRALLAAASCVAVPSRDEGFALPIAEAVACGGRVVANDIAVLRELAQPDVTFAPARDARAFGAALLAAADAPRTPASAQAARERRTWDDVGREVWSLLSR